MVLSEEKLKLAAEQYEGCVPIAVIAEGLGVTRQALWRAMRERGVETRKGVASKRLVKCDVCGVEFGVVRSRLRRMGVMKFCSLGCRDVWLEGRESFVNRLKQRVARVKIGEVFELGEGNVVHHIDRDHYNTHLSNFLVFKDQSDHIKYHHQLRLAEAGKGRVEVQPVWSGPEYCNRVLVNRVEVKRPNPKSLYDQGVFRPYSKSEQLGKRG